MNTSYLEQITEILDRQNLEYRLLESLNITDFQDYKCYYILIENRILYVVSIGEADGQKSQLFFKNLQRVAHLNKEQKLTFIMDATQLNNIPASVRKEIHFFDLSFRKYWSKILFIYEGMAKMIMDMYETHKPEHVNGVEKVSKPQLAIDYAVNGIKPDISEEEHLNSLSRAELIEEILKLKSQNSLRSSEEKKTEDQLINVLTDITWKKEKTHLLKFDREDAFSPAYGLLNTIITDFKEVNQELDELKDKFYNKLQFQVGEIIHQEASLRAIFDSFESIVWMIDAEFNILAFNNKFHQHIKRHYGIAPELGHNSSDSPSACPAVGRAHSA